LFQIGGFSLFAGHFLSHLVHLNIYNTFCQESLLYSGRVSSTTSPQLPLCP
jgi:hypothetical protein